jgi:hypothetical protein
VVPLLLAHTVVVQARQTDLLCLLLLLLLLFWPFCTFLARQLCEQAVEARGAGTVCVIANYLFPQVSNPVA